MSSIITLPSFCYFSDAKIKFTRGSSVLRSKYTGKRQTLAFPYALWVFDGTLCLMTQAEALPWRSFLMQLHGQANLFRLPVPGTENGPSTGYAGTVGHVVGAGQTGNSLVTGGWTPSVGLIVNAGDYFTVNDELKVCTAADGSAGDGSMTLYFEPSLRYSPANSTPITITSPTMLLSLTTDDVEWDLTTPVNHAIAVSGIEAYE